MDEKRTPLTTLGQDQGNGNILSIQCETTAYDYSTPSRFESKIRALYEAAKQRGLLNDKTVVLFPEGLGVWLFLLGESILTCDSHQPFWGILFFIMTHPISFYSMYKRHCKDFPHQPRHAHLISILIRIKATRIAAVYHNIFSKLSKEYGVTTIAGSLFLPAPHADEALVVDDIWAPLYNVTPVYLPDGTLHPGLVRKHYLTPPERPFLTSAPERDAPQVVATPAGRVAVFICADSFFPRHYQMMRLRGARHVAVPAFLSDAFGDGWDRPVIWRKRGHPEAETRLDADQRALWHERGLPAHMREYGYTRGCTAFGRTTVWGQQGFGDSLLCAHKETTEVASGTPPAAPRRATGSALGCVWL